MNAIGFVRRDAFLWGALFGTAFVARSAMDWFAPPADFQTRAMVSTWVGIGLLLAAGCSAAWRSRSLVAGTIAGIAAAAVGAAISLVGAVALLAVWHDPATMAAIRASGGLTEVFTLPVAMLVPGLVLGSIGGAAGVTLRHLHRA
jgi:hypothetical protein